MAQACGTSSPSPFHCDVREEDFTTQRTLKTHKCKGIGRASRKVPRPLTTRRITPATCDPDILEAAIAVSEKIRDPLSIRAGDQRDIYDQDGNHLSTLVIHSMTSVTTSSEVKIGIHKTIGVVSPAPGQAATAAASAPVLRTAAKKRKNDSR